MTDDEEKTRFEVELEFIQCLASPAYLHFLAQNRYFDDDDFLNYLNYLQYWRKPEYIKFIIFPQSLFFLQLLQEKEFREALKRHDYYIFVHQQQGYFWQFARTMKEKKDVEVVKEESVKMAVLQ